MFKVDKRGAVRLRFAIISSELPTPARISNSFFRNFSMSNRLQIWSCRRRVGIIMAGSLLPMVPPSNKMPKVICRHAVA